MNRSSTRSRLGSDEARSGSGAQGIAVSTVSRDEPLRVGSGCAVVKRRGVGGGRGKVLVLPPFGIPAAALEVVASLVAAHGYEALLLDPRDSNGTGSGQINDFLLSTLLEDCRAAVEHYRPDVVLAVSLSARVAARALADLPNAPRCVFLLPVVDVRSTLATVLGRDWFELPLAAVPYEVAVLGFKVRSEPFRTDCLELEILSPESMSRDLAAIGAPVTLLPGTKDPWIDHSTATDVVDAAAVQHSRVSMRSLACDQHELHKHPALAMRLITEAVGEACSHADQHQN